jgi:hypothetical protein
MPATLVRQNCDPAAYAAGLTFFNVREPNGILNPYAAPDVNAESRPLLEPHDGHRGVEDVTLDGRWVLYVKAVGGTRAMSMAEPGKGVNNVLKVLDTATGETHDLMADSEAGPVAQGKRFGVMWADFNRPAPGEQPTKVSWTQLRKAASWSHPAGTWELHVADVTADWRLENELVWAPPVESFVEVYGWVPNAQLWAIPDDLSGPPQRLTLPGSGRIVFASEYGAVPDAAWTNAQLWAIPDDLSGPPQRLTPPFASGANRHPYHEFANWLPDGRLVTSVVRDAKSSGMDLWAYDLWADDPAFLRERLTWFGGKPGPWGSWQQVDGWPAPAYSIVLGGMAVYPDGALLIGRTSQLSAGTIDAWLVTR